MMEPSSKDQIEGTFYELKGKAKTAAGELTNDPDLAADGRAEEIGGKIQKKIGQIEKVFEK